MYRHKYTYAVAKKEDLVSVHAFCAAPEKCYVSGGEYLHSLGQTQYDEDNGDPNSSLSALSAEHECPNWLERSGYG